LHGLVFALAGRSRIRPRLVRRGLSLGKQLGVKFLRNDCPICYAGLASAPERPPRRAQRSAQDPRGALPVTEHVVDGLLAACDTGRPNLDCARAKRRQRMQNASTATLALAGVLSLTVSAQAQAPNPPANPPATAPAPGTAASAPEQAAQPDTAPETSESASIPADAPAGFVTDEDADVSPAPAGQEPVAPEPTRDARTLAAQGEAGPVAPAAGAPSLTATP